MNDIERNPRKWTRKPKMKVGDWGYNYRYQLYLIEDVFQFVNTGNFRYCIHEGCLSTVADENEFFPLTLDSKRMSDEFNFCEKDLFQTCKGVNQQTISNQISWIWLKTMSEINSKKLTKINLSVLHKFCLDVKVAVRKRNELIVGGKNIFE